MHIFLVLFCLEHEMNFALNFSIISIVKIKHNFPRIILHCTFLFILNHMVLQLVFVSAEVLHFSLHSTDLNHYDVVPSALIVRLILQEILSFAHLNKCWVILWLISSSIWWKFCQVRYPFSAGGKKKKIAHTDVPHSHHWLRAIDNRQLT